MHFFTSLCHLEAIYMIDALHRVSVKFFAIRHLL